MSEPHFPPPRRARPATPSEPAAVTPQAPSSVSPRTVVRRPAEPIDDDVTNRGAAGKLSADEVRALLAVHEATRPVPWKRAAKRGGALLLPVSVASVVLDLVLGSYGIVATLVLVVASLAWAARPLLRNDEWGRRSPP